MIRRPPRSTRTDTLFPYTTLFRSDYEFAGREFELDRGIIRFAGEVPANPALDISANASETGLNATIHVTGNAQKPEISFTSIPALPEDELMSRLLFGTSITNLSAPEALQLAARSEEHTSELQSLMRSSYAGFCLKNKK